MKITEHFTLEEMTFSNTATRYDIDNSIRVDTPLFSNIVRTARRMEEVRAFLSAVAGRPVPIFINSGYRGLALNSKIGGSKTSAHMKALAVDFRAPKFGTPAEIVRELSKSDIEFDQLICEFNAWVHIGLTDIVPRRQILEAIRVAGKTTYSPFEVS